MYPHYPHYWRHYARGPSRILWFVIGAGAATWWHKHREMHNHGWSWGHCRRVAIQNAPHNTPSSSPATNAPMDSNTPDSSSFSFKDISKTINNIPPAGWSWGAKEAEGYKEEQDHLIELRRQATDAMSDMTEATLESILTGAEALKAKLVANRELHKKQEEQLKREMEEQSKNPPRLI